MAELLTPAKPLSEMPLKSSAPLGAAMAFLGIDGAMPLFHGSQGCTSFALVLMVRHFKEAIPLQTTAMNEVSTILGGADNLELAILNLAERTKAKLIGVCTTALTETRGEDMAGDVRAIAARHGEALKDTQLCFASTPDFDGGLEDGWAKAVLAMVRQLVPEVEGPERLVQLRQVNVLAGPHLTPADIEELRDVIELFGLTAIILPDISGSLDGHVPEGWVPTAYGGTQLDDVARMGQSALTIAVGASMRKPAAELEMRTGVPYRCFDTLSGLKPFDLFLAALSELSGKPVPARLRRWRSQLVDALMDAHFHIGGKRLAIAADPDLLYQLASVYAGLGAQIAVAITTSKDNPALARVPTATVQVGDLSDLERQAVARQCDVLLTHAHGRLVSEATGIPLLRVGFPCFDRLGAAHRLSLGYRGTRAMAFELANHFQSRQHSAHPGDWAPTFQQEESRHDGSIAAA